MYAMGAEFVEVRVHAQTREIRVPRIVGAFAAGRLMNTRTARSQYMGAMIWGICSALHEATEIDERYRTLRQRQSGRLSCPVNADIQQLEVILVPEEDNFVNPAGVKGIGELGNVGTAAAVANAVYHATGVRVRQLPIRLEKTDGLARGFRRLSDRGIEGAGIAPLCRPRPGCAADRTDGWWRPSAPPSGMRHGLPRILSIVSGLPSTLRTAVAPSATTTSRLDERASRSSHQWQRSISWRSASCAAAACRAARI